jgi:histidyl-tRNA synthetase
LDQAGVSYVLDPRMVRGLDYYTRSVFEWVSSALASDQASTINAGGRYDGLAEALGGQPTPGVGFAMGLDRVLLAIDAEGAPLPPPRSPRCFVVAIGSDAEPEGRRLIAELRDRGVSAAGSSEERPLKAQLKMADRAGAQFVAILGEQELANDTVTLRRLVDGVQKSVPTADLVGWLTKLDGWVD